MGEQPPSKPRIILYDIETAPNLGWIWGKYEQDVIDFKAGWYLLSFAWKELGVKKVNFLSLPDFPNFKKDKEDDSALVKELWKIFDTANILIAHNGDKFDLKKGRARFVKHGLPPPSPVKQIDTLKIARTQFAFTSNKLDDLSAYLRIGRKLPNLGFPMWRGCMTGDPKSWAQMRRYNVHDVELLEAVYLRLRAWSPSHPNLAAYTESRSCPVCESDRVQRRGWNIAKVRRSPRFQCSSCGHWWSGRLAA